MKSKFLIGISLVICSINLFADKCKDKPAPGVDWSGCDVFRYHLNLDYANLESANLENADFIWMNLRHANLKGANIKKARFEVADISAADFSNTKGESANFIAVRAYNTSFHQANLKSANFSYSPNLDYTNFEGAYLGNANFTRVKMRHSKLRGATIIEAIFDWADISATDLTRMNGERSKFRNVIAYKALLYRSYLVNSKFESANLDHVYLQGSDLEGADFTGARMMHANLTETHIKETVFKGADISWAFLADVRGWHTDFADVTAYHTFFVGAFLPYSRFSKTIDRSNPNYNKAANLYRADFRNATLAGSVFDKTGFGWANLARVDLRGASGLDTSYFWNTNGSGTAWVDGRICRQIVPRYDNLPGATCISD